MVRTRVLVGLVLVAGVAMTMVTVPAGAHYHDGFATVVREYAAEGVDLHLDLLQLAPGEAHAGYFFGVVADATDGVAAGHAQVRAVGNRDPLCGGALASGSGVSLYVTCNALETDVPYELQWTVAEPGMRVVLYGHGATG